MANSVRIVNGEGLQSAELKLRGEAYALTVATTPLLESTPTTRPYLNDTFGSAMNQNVTFAGTAENIHDGGDTAGWTAAAGAGVWDFADSDAEQAGTNGISITTANNNDIALFTDGTETNMSNYTAFTGQVQLVSGYNPLQNGIVIELKNNGVAVGQNVNLNDYIDTALIGSFQKFVISKSDMAADSITIDELDIRVTRSGGTRPTIYFDKLQIEETGAPLIYSIVPRASTKFHVTKLIIALADVGTGGTANAYNKIGALSALAVGIVINTIVDNRSLFSATVRQISDLLDTGGFVNNLIDDGTNTYMSLEIDLFETAPIILDSRREGDILTATINDNLSGLLKLTIFARGHEEVI